MFNWQYMNMSVKGALTIDGIVSTVINPWFGRCYT